MDGWPRHLCLNPVQNIGISNFGVFSYANVLEFNSEDIRFENWSLYELNYSHFRGIP